MTSSTRYRWNGTTFVDITGLPEVDLLVADSFLTRDGRVVAFDHHADRFQRSAITQGLLFPSPSYIEAFAHLIPRTDTWFPRLDLTARGEIECWMRPAPPLTSSVTLASADHDPRTEPAIKGPDLTVLNSLRENARERGADDAVILSPAGHEMPGRIIDGATTCLVWWRDGALTMPPPQATRVDSVTVRIVREIARDRGIAVSTEWTTPAQLNGTTVWALNALHGIRDVTGWIDGPTLAPNPDLLAEWRADYERRREPLPALAE